jgi:hypothetical protein
MLKVLGIDTDRHRELTTSRVWCPCRIPTTLASRKRSTGSVWSRCSRRCRSCGRVTVSSKSMRISGGARSPTGRGT